MESHSENLNERESEYGEAIESKIRVAAVATRLRAFGVQLLWIVVIVAGAGVPLNAALDGPGWIGPTLGFVVVVAAGVERIFGRTTSAAAAHDELRRNLAREHRLFAARAGAYAESETPFEVYTTRCEEIIERHDQTMVAHGSTMTRQSD